MRTRLRRALGMGALAVCIGAVHPALGRAQAAKADTQATQPAPTIVTVEQPDAQHTKDELSSLLDHYPPTLRGVLALDPSLLSNPSYLAPYPLLASFLNAHPDVTHNPAFYIGEGSRPRTNEDYATQVLDMWKDALNGLGIFVGFGLAIGLVVWLIRTLVDYKRWSRITKVQTEVHAKLLDRFTANDELLAYIQSPAGSRFLQSSPITLDAAPRSVGAPLARILWSVQGGIVLIAGGIGLLVVSGRVADVASQPLRALGVLGIALGVGFVIAALISFLISQRLGLIEPGSVAARAGLPSV